MERVGGASPRLDGGAPKELDASTDAATHDAARLLDAASLTIDGGDERCGFTDAGASSQASMFTNSTDVGTIAYYSPGPLPSLAGNIPDLTVGPDGNLWFTVNGTVVENGAAQIRDTSCTANYIARMTPAGLVTRFPLPLAESGGGTLMPDLIVTGSDGNLWFSTLNHAMGRITTSGVVTQFAVQNAESFALAAGSDGNVWFVDSATRGLGRIAGSGVVTAYPLGGLGLGFPAAIAAASNGGLWLTEDTLVDGSTSARFERIGDDGGLSGVDTGFAGHPTSITTDSAGNLWFSAPDRPSVGRIDPAGAFTEVPIPCAVAFTSPYPFVAPRKAGGVWFMRPETDAIGFVDEHGTVACNTARGPAGIGWTAWQPSRLAASDHDMWFIENGLAGALFVVVQEGLVIGRLTP